MANNAGVLREYLTKLGFKIDEQQYKKFKLSLEQTAKFFENVTKAATSAGSAVAVEATLIARSLEKLYFTSQRTGSSANNLKAFANAAEQIGVSSDEALGSVESLMRSLRLNPGLRGLLGNLQIDPDSKDGVKLLLQLVDRLSKMPFFAASQIAGQFGIDDSTLLMLEKNREALGKYYEQQQKVQAGIEKASVNSRVFMESLRGVEQATEAVGFKLADKLLPNLTMCLEFWRNSVTTLGQLVDRTNSWGTALENVATILKSIPGVNKLMQWSENASEFWFPEGQYFDSLGRAHQFPKQGKIAPRKSWSSEFLNAPAAKHLKGLPDSVKSLIDSIATQFGVDPTLAERVAMQESGGNQSAISKKGAIGIFQLMPGTARGLGVDPHDTTGNITGGVKYLRELLDKYKGNTTLALAEYNAGPLAMKKYGGVPPFAETQNYLRNILGYQLGAGSGTGTTISVESKTEINVNGSESPAQVGRSVANEQQRVNGDLVRNLGGAVN